MSNVNSNAAEPQRDYTKFRFNGNKYSKGKLVLAIIQHYMNENPKTTVSQLKKVFPEELQNRFPVVAPVKEAKKLGKTSTGEKIKRFFLNEDQLIKTKNGFKFAVTNYWGSSNIQPFIDHVKKEFGYRIVRTAA